MSVEFWSAACNASASRPLSQKLQENAGGYYFAIAAYTAAAVYSGYWMLKYYVLRLSEGRRIDDLVWSKLGIYLFVVFLASLSGAVTRAGWMLAAEYRFSRDYAMTDQEFYLLDREELQVYVHYRIMRGIETPFLSIAFLMVLNRLTNHAFTVKSMDQRSRRSGASASGKVGISQSTKGKLRMLFNSGSVAAIATLPGRGFALKSRPMMMLPPPVVPLASSVAPVSVVLIRPDCAIVPPKPAPPFVWM